MKLTGCQEGKKERVAVVIRNVGDYHAPRFLRLQADLSRGGNELLIIEAAQESSFYKHPQTRAAKLKKRLNCVILPSSTRFWKIVQVIRSLHRYRATAILVIGYNDELSLSALFASKLLGARIFFLGDSKADDQHRFRASEWVKRRLISLFDGALVAGARHKEYFSSLGMNPTTIDIGYDVIDNVYFANRAQRYKSKIGLLKNTTGSPSKYVLCVSRLVRRKRVDVAIDIFSRSNLSQRGFKLIIVGAGPESQRLQSAATLAGIDRYVIFCGAVKSSRMPMYYANAEALILTSEYDQWGLVVNEALACGVPALITARCGAAGEILLHDVNGYIWDGQDVDSAAALLSDLVLNEAKRRRFRLAAKVIIAIWGLDRFSAGALRLIKAT